MNRKVGVSVGMTNIRPELLPTLKKPESKISPDPTSNIEELFVQYDEKYFQGELKRNRVSFELTRKIEGSAGAKGYCYELEDKIQGCKRCYIVLNKPMLISESRICVIECLLHHMIHGMLKVKGIEECSHGPEFCRMMEKINTLEGINMTVRHKHSSGDTTKSMVKPKSKDAVKNKPKCVARQKSMTQEERKKLKNLNAKAKPSTLKVLNAKPRHKSSSDAPMTPKKPKTEKFVSPQAPRAAPFKHAMVMPSHISRMTIHDSIKRDIMDLYKGKFDARCINLIGYDDSDSETDYSDDSDSETDYLYEIEFDGHSAYGGHGAYGGY